MYRNRNKLISSFEKDWGVFFEGATDMLKPEWKQDFASAIQSPEWARTFKMAQDAQPSLITTPNSGIPAFLTNFIDPDILRVLVALNEAAEIVPEVRKGDWEDRTAMFPTVEHTGEVSSYGDFSQNGRAGANANWEVREQYLYQIIMEYGELEIARAGRGRLSWASELKQASINILNKFQNLSYFQGIQGLQNYGLLNAPGLNAPIAPSPKANGGVSWFIGNTTSPNATANEVYNDIIALVTNVVNQSQGNVKAKDEFVLALSPKSSMALTFANTFNVNVIDLVKKNFPNLRVQTAVQYGGQSSQNPQGNAAGELVQLIAVKAAGQDTAWVAFGDKLRAGPIIRELSSFKQKMVQSTWGAVVRQPYAFSQMLGV